MIRQMHKRGSGYAFVGALTAACTSPLTTRERSELIGAGLGAAGGAILGGSADHLAIGALIGGPLGLVAGLLIGDQFMDYEKAGIERAPPKDRYGAEAGPRERVEQRLGGEAPR
jgi:osmotically inducible lipoprotein OsmB